MWRSVTPHRRVVLTVNASKINTHSHTLRAWRRSMFAPGAGVAHPGGFGAGNSFKSSFPSFESSSATQGDGAMQVLTAYQSGM